MTLSSFGITQPLLDALSRRTAFLYEQQINWSHIAILLTLLNVVVPLALIVCDWAVQSIAELIGRGRDAIFVLLMLIVLLSLARPSLSSGWLASQTLAGPVALIVLTPAALGIVSLYERSRLCRSWFTAASIGTVVFTSHFLWSFSIWHQNQGACSAPSRSGNPVPVVIVFYDEFSATTLLNQDDEIDAQRFPNLARLQSMSTFYRNATTVHPRTDVAVPAMLTGCFAADSPFPITAANPANLFQLIESTGQYELAVFEPVTRLYREPDEIKGRPRNDFGESCLTLIQSLSAVYPRLILPGDTPVPFPVIPREWFAYSWPVVQPNSLVKTEGVFRDTFEPGRKDLFDHFLKCIHRSDRPRFCFFHTVLPHYPWCFLPTGEQYLSDVEANRYRPSGASGELGEVWRDDPALVGRSEQRYRLQVGYVDQQVGQLLDRLEATGLLDECLLIIAGDHGVSFRPGHSRRLPDAETLPDILSVPLFIKLPGQRTGAINDRNVQSIDLLPTVAEVLELSLPNPIDGLSVTNELRSPRKSFYFENRETIIDARFLERQASRIRQWELFGDGPLDQPVAAFSTHPDWHGLPVTNFAIDPRLQPYTYMEWSADVAVEIPSAKLISRRFVSGWLRTDQLPDTKGDLVVIVDGVIVDSGTTFPMSRQVHAFEFLIPMSVDVSPTSLIEIYLVSCQSGQPRLNRLENSREIPIPYREL